MSRRSWMFWEAIAPKRPKWLHMVLCPFCRGYLLYARPAIRSGEIGPGARANQWDMTEDCDHDWYLQSPEGNWSCRNCRRIVDSPEPPEDDATWLARQNDPDRKR